MSIIQGNSIESGVSTYQIERSLRFNSADSAYLSRTPASAGNRKTWTWSGWVKRSTLDSNMQALFGCIDSGAAYYTNLVFDNTTPNTLVLYDNLVGGSTVVLRTTQLFRDVSAWYHIVLAYDTTQATAANRVKLYVNGSQITAFSTDARSSLTQNADGSVNRANQHGIGTRQPYQGNYFNGYLTEVNFIDGQALDPTSFGEYNSDTGVWQPKAYTGSYGTNGFYLDFADNSNTTAATLGKDYSGNSNNWTPNNFSVTAGAGNDSLVDSPTRYGTDTGVGGEVRGNYATFNPNLYNAGSVSYSNGNLLMTMTGNADRFNIGTLAVSSGKWYWELTVAGLSASNNVGIGISKASKTANGPWVSYGGPDTIYFNTSDGWSVYGTNTGGGTGSFSNGDVLGVALDMDSNVVSIYDNGTLVSSKSGAINTSVPHTLFINTYASGSNATLNAGQRPFAYTAPSGFKALCTQNLPEPTVADGGEYFNALTYTGTGASNSLTGVGFQPDLVWVKDRGNVRNHYLWDSNRGVLKELYSNLTNAESTNTIGLSAFNSDGFTLNNGDNAWNGTGISYVAWNWKANGAGVSNTAGTISSTVSANTTAGFSIVTYTGNATANQTVGHGLGVAPSMIIVKNRTTSGASWATYHASVGIGKYLELNKTDAPTTNSAFFDQVTSTVFGFDAGGLFINSSGDNYVAYCFAAVPGFSAFGSYVGNGSSDGPFVYTGFRPKFLLVKSATTAQHWIIDDTTRNPYNITNLELYPSLSNAESSDPSYDLLSNGFKLRITSLNKNASGVTYIYAAFAEVPMKFALGR